MDVGGDALLYSTNLQLALTGGVGASLRGKFGLEIQYALNAAADMAGRTAVEVGDVFETSLPGLPWRHVFHSVATTEQYHTEPRVVSRILHHCLRRCTELGCRRLVTSPLGAGYGDLELPDYVRLLDEALAAKAHGLHEICVVCWDRHEFQKLLAATTRSSFQYEEEREPNARMPIQPHD
ncbi:MAG: macro domain-containing protein [Verrucomicrobia bacterium]|nr:macro domain-containing protein [Verrucomicrobiota bacterium]